METFLDSALFITEDGNPVAIKWLNQKNHTVIMFKLEVAGIEEEKDLLDRCIYFKENGKI